MILKYWLFMILVGCSAYGAMRDLFGAHLLYDSNHWQYYFYWSAPFILAFLSAKGWRTSRMWRRMMDHRYPPLTLSRGEPQRQKSAPRPSILERICAALSVLALAAILNIFAVNNIAWWIGALIGSWACLRMALMAVRRP